MKSDLSFPLESAGWPAFSVENGGVLRQANLAAVSFFGPKLDGEGLLLSALWAEEGETAEKFLARWEHSAPPVVLLKFRGKGGVATLFSTYICAQRDGQSGQKRYVFQLFKETPAAPPPSSEVKAGAPDAVAHRQKLDCAMQLARTVALDFNNALTSVLGHTSLMLTQIEANHPCRASLREVEKAAQKAAEITHQLAAFSRQEKETPAQRPGNLNTLLRRLVESFQPTKPPGLQWSLQLQSQLYGVKFDEPKLQQALLKICENAIEAVGANGRLGVSSRSLDLTELTQDRTAQLQPGSYVCVEITDDGAGISAEVLPRVFEPFFSTKPGHRGLGLALVYGILTNHGGNIALSSTPGQGTSVRVYLPASPTFVPEEGTGKAELTGNRTILVVDDEELLLSTLQAILTAFGYRVLTATSGARALEIVATAPLPIDLVITDLVMPQMSGRELIDQLQMRAPQLPILCTSGYVVPTGPEAGQTHLAKPFTSLELLRRVKQMLGAAPVE